MTGNGNGIRNTNGHSHRWWQIWKRRRGLDLSTYRRVALQLHHGLPRSEGHSRSVLIVSPDDSRHSAACCVTLASCMAEELRRLVLLVDASPGFDVSRMVHSSSSEGLTDFLLDPMRPLQNLVQPTSQDNVWFLSRGTSQDSSFPAFPENSRDLLVRATRQWDFVVVDGGGALKNSLALAMAPYVGRVLLLVVENQTQVEDIDAAQSALELCGARDVSLILTENAGTVR